MSQAPVREKLLTFRLAAIAVAAACALTLGACRSPETSTATGAGAGSTPTTKAGAVTPTTKAKKPPSPFEKTCASVASFQYFNHMPDSGKPKKDPIANDPAAVQKKLKEIGETITKAVPELSGPIQEAQTTRVGAAKPDGSAWTAASTKIADWTKSNC